MTETKTQLILKQYETALQLAGVQAPTREQLSVLEQSLNSSMGLLQFKDSPPINPALKETFGANYKTAKYAEKAQITRVRGILEHMGSTDYSNQDVLKAYHELVNKGKHLRMIGEKTIQFLENYLKQRKLI